MTIEVKDGIVLKPVGRVDLEGLKEALDRHLELIRRDPNTIEPKPGELAKAHFEEEFEDIHRCKPTDIPQRYKDA